jgi:DNA-binding transcriptional MocR family regulator
MLPKLHTDPNSTTPLYRQIYEQLSSAILTGKLARGERLPATRELAGSIGLNRTTIAAAYELLEAEGLIRSHVGKGTFVIGPETTGPETTGPETARPAKTRLENAEPKKARDWNALFARRNQDSAPMSYVSRPSDQGPARDIVKSGDSLWVSPSAAFELENDLGSDHENPREIGERPQAFQPPGALHIPPSAAQISFSASRPSQDQFPLEEFRATVREVIDSPEAAQILQLGPASGYGPLRGFILNDARHTGTAREDDDVLITSGVQQAFDLIQRVLASRGETVVIEDPVYPGLRNAFQRGGARVIGAPMGPDGVDFPALQRILEKETPRLMVLTPNFQNPTGTTIPAATRKEILALARRAGTVVIENDLYGDLRYKGDDIPSIKRMDESGDTILLGSFSKIAFPGLRVGWVIGPRHFIARLTEAKEASDLHSDQLSQAVLLRFAESGRLAAHRKKMIVTGAERLDACLEGCAQNLPDGSEYTRPEGGMNVWVRLPEPLDAAELAARALRENISFLPGRYFAVSRAHPHSLRLSFIGLNPDQIQLGLSVLGTIIESELSREKRAREARRDDPSPALV